MGISSGDLKIQIPSVLCDSWKAQRSMGEFREHSSYNNTPQFFLEVQVPQ